MIKEPIYVVHKHYASHLHYDLRLEMNGVLKSWAVPKGPSLDPKDKRLAVEVDDHDLEYADFEGEIPEGMYGAGKVEIWDKGNYHLIKQEPNLIEFEAKGNKMAGAWTLVRIKGREPGDKAKNWLLIRKKT